MQFDSEQHPHRRWNPLIEEWLLVSPHRAKRPWEGRVEKPAPADLPEYDPNCYLCPGNHRAGGVQNPNYTTTFVFENDFPALMSESPSEGGVEACNGLVRESAETGICRVICFSPKHQLTLAQMEVSDIRGVIDLWCDQYAELAAREDIQTVTLFENRGEMMGCSNPHPHGQLWANRGIPTIQQKELQAQQNYYAAHGAPLLLDYWVWERAQQKRVLLENEHFAVIVPHWAVWPFETLLLPRRAMSSLLELRDDEKEAWAELLKALLIRYDNLFETSFPYSMGIHQQPATGETMPGFVWHQHFYPPLLRSATIKKFQVGYEMLGEPQRDITPEQATQRLRSLSATHYAKKSLA